MVESGYDKPLPVLDDDSRSYWEAAQRHELVVPRCNDCRRLVFYPRSFCPHCEGSSLTPEKISGAGQVYSFTVVRIPVGPQYQNDVPYVVALVDLDVGIRIMANVLDCNPDEVVVGTRVTVVFREVTPEVTLPQFTLVRAGHGG